MSVNNTHLQSRTQNTKINSPAIVPETQFNGDLLYMTVREGDDSFASTYSFVILTTPKISKLLNNNDVGELNALIDENIARKATVECLQTEHLEMENVVIRKDETIIYKTY